MPTSPTHMNMQLLISVAFTESVELVQLPTEAALTAANLFKATPNTGLVTRLGADPDEGLVPSILSPTNIYFQEILRRFRQNKVRIDGTRWPLIGTFDGVEVRLITTIRLLPPNVLVTTVKVNGLKIGSDNLVNDLIASQKQGGEIVRDLLRWTADIVGACDHRPTGVETYRKIAGSPLPAIHVRVPAPVATIAEWSDKRQPQLLAALIRDVQHESSDPAIEASLVRKNAELNRKGGSRTWVDKQGALLVSSDFDRDGSPGFARLVDMQAVVLAMRTLFSEYPRRRRESPYSFDFLLQKSLTWIREPGRVLRKSVGSRELWKLLADEFALSQDADHLSSDPAVRERLDAGRDVFAGTASWWLTDDLETQLAEEMSAQRVEPSQQASVVQIIHATQAQISARDINNFASFDEFVDALREALEGVVDIDVATKQEALGLVDKLRMATGSMATVAGGGAAAAVVGAAIKQLLGLS
jgi:hypothetical protein